MIKVAQTSIHRNKTMIKVAQTSIQSAKTSIHRNKSSIQRAQTSIQGVKDSIPNVRDQAFMTGTADLLSKTCISPTPASDTEQERGALDEN